MDPLTFLELLRLPSTLCLSILLGCISPPPANGQTGEQNGARPGLAENPDTADAAWSQRILLASGDSFVGTLSGWRSDGDWLFDVDTPPTETTNERSTDRRQRIVDASQLVRYGASPLPRSTSSVLFVDGSELAGRIVELNADTCRVVSRWFDVSIPLESIRSLLFHAPVDDQIRQRQLQPAERASGADDVIILMDGGRREGTLRLPQASFSPRRAEAAVELKTAADEVVSIPLRRIRSIILSPILREGLVRRFGAGQGREATGNAPPARMRIGLVDGSVLSVRRRTLTEDAGLSSIVLECGVELTRRTNQSTELTEMIAMLAPVLSLESGLPTEPPLRFRHLPFFGEAYPLVRWSDAQGGPALDGLRYPNGLMMRTAARAVYPTKGAKRLAGAVAAAEPDWDTVTDVQMESNLGIRFRVQTSSPRGDVEQLWDSGVVRPGQPPILFDLDISEAALIILAVDPVDSGDFGDRAVWLDLVVAGGNRR